MEPLIEMNNFIYFGYIYANMLEHGGQPKQFGKPDNPCKHETLN